MTTRKVRAMDYDVGFQSRMVRTLFQEPDFTLALGTHLNSACFSKRTHRWAAKTIIDYAERHGCGISSSALAIEAKRAAKLGTLPKDQLGQTLAFCKKMSTPVRDRSFIKEEFFRFVKHQTTEDVILETVELLKDQNYEEIDRQIQRIQDVQMAHEGGYGHKLIGDSRDRYKKRKTWTPEGISTGIRGVDLLMKSHGVIPKQLAGVIGAPGSGKTASLVHIGKSAIMNSDTPVLHFSLEMDEIQVIDRYDAAFTGIPISELEKGKNPWKVRKFMRQLGEDMNSEPLIVKEFPAGQATVAMLKAHTRQLERKGFYPGMIIVDYAGLLKPTIQTGNPYEDLGMAVVELRAWAKTAELPIWTAFQGNRSSLGKEIITLKELADSFQTAMHADVLLALCQTEDEKMRKLARFFMLKNRNGIADQEVPVSLDWSRPTVISHKVAA